MADNLNITSGSGVVVATDDVSNVHYQRIKLVDGNLESTNATGVAVNPLIVAVSNSSATVSVLNTLSIVSILNTSATISVLNTGGLVQVSGNISVLNTLSVISILNTSATISVLNTGGLVQVSGNISVLNTLSVVSVLNTVNAVSLLNTSGTISVLNTLSIISVLNTSNTISVLNTGGSVNVLNTRISVSIDKISFTPVWKYSVLTSNNEVTLWNPSTSYRFVLTDITINAVTAGTCTVREGVAGTTMMIVSLADGGGWVSNLSTPYRASNTSTPLTVQASKTNQYICISGYEIL